MGRYQTPWTEEDKKTAFEMYAKGVSCRWIGAHFGRTRNSVIGMMYRSGVHTGRSTMEKPPKPPAPPKPTNTISLAPIRKPSIVTQLLKLKSPIPEPAGEGRIAFPAWTNSRCKYVMGAVNGAETIACGEPSISHTRPWCKYHAQIVYTPARPK
jgi:hypothetical protein